MSSERGSGSVLSVAILAGVLGMGSILVPLSVVLSARAQVASAADAAALAAADTLVGIVPGLPCAAATSVAEANSVKLASCRIDGAVVTVRVSRRVLGFVVAVQSTAGPPGSSL